MVRSLAMGSVHAVIKPGDIYIYIYIYFDRHIKPGDIWSYLEVI